MSRWIHLFFTLGIVTFWVTMNLQLALRELEMRQLDEYPSGVTRFLGNELYRESWLGIYRDKKKIGYTGYTLERVFEEEGVRHHLKLESVGKFEFFGREIEGRIEGNAIADVDMAPETLDMDLTLGAVTVTLTGERRGEEFVIRGENEGMLGNFERAVPLESLSFSNGFSLDLPLAGFEVGETYEISVYNPLSLSGDRSRAKIEVLGTTTQKVEGQDLECFHLRTRMLGREIDSWVTADGTTLRQELPPPLNYTLVRETRRNARRGFLER